MFVDEAKVTLKAGDGGKEAPDLDAKNSYLWAVPTAATEVRAAIFGRSATKTSATSKNTSSRPI